MVRKKKRTTPEDELRGPIIERPDGFYWQSKETGKEYGPFATLAEGEADRLTGGEIEGEVEPGPQTLAEPCLEAGISDRIDPDTGGAAEDSIPHVGGH